MEDFKRLPEDGVGYDLEVQSPLSTKRVAIKGIESAKIQFNLTLKELFLAKTDPACILVTLTHALTDSLLANEFAGSAVHELNIFPTQYRVMENTKYTG